MNNNPFKSNSGFKDRKPSQEVTDFHRRDDVDSSSQAHHHTLGGKPGQAASGALLQALIDAGALGRVGDYVYNDTDEETPLLLLCDGASVTVAAYPELFAHFADVHGSGYHFGGAGANFNLPDLRGKVIAAVNAGGLVLTTLGDYLGFDFVDLDHVHTTPAHNHTGPNHQHTVTNEPNHNHSIPQHDHGLGAGVTAATQSGTGVQRMTGGGSTGLSSGALNTGNGGAHDHGGNTGLAGTGNTGNASPSTDSTNFDSTLLDFWTNNLPMQQATYTSRIFIRAKLMP